MLYVGAVDSSCIIFFRIRDSDLIDCAVGKSNANSTEMHEPCFEAALVLLFGPQQTTASS